MGDGRVPEDGWEVRRGTEGYPASLEDVRDVAETVYGIGERSVLSGMCVSIIGARRATPYGLAVAEMAGRIAAECGVTVVSGGAIGCDQAAGRAAIAAGGRTVVVAGSGADVVYPRSSASLFRDAVETGGAVVSLEGWGSPPRRYAFPKRNRVIAALSRSVIVTEAGRPSGTFGTASAAADLGRTLYAVPGPIFSPNSRGANELIEEGAFIIPDETALELRMSMDYGCLRTPGDVVTPDRGQVLSALVASPSRPEVLAERLGVGVLTVMRTLSDYEGRGLAERLPDGRYAPSKRAYLEDNGREKGSVPERGRRRTEK